MFWFLYFEFIVLPVTVVINVIALSLLYYHKDKRRYQHQIYIISALCLCELNGSLFIIVYNILVHQEVSPTFIGICWFYLHLFVRLTYYSTMTLLTIDRYLVFRLSLRYFGLQPAKRLLRTVVFIYYISFVIYICFICLIVLELIDWMKISDILFLVYFTWDVICIGLVVATYFYIFVVYKKHMKFKNDHKSQPRYKEHFKLHIPTLLIVTSVIFVCIPDFVIFFIYFQLLKGTGIICNIMAIFYRIAWLVDPAIYIYSSTLFRKTLFKETYRKTAATQV